MIGYFSLGMCTRCVPDSDSGGVNHGNIKVYYRLQGWGVMANRINFTKATLDALPAPKKR